LRIIASAEPGTYRIERRRVSLKVRASAAASSYHAVPVLSRFLADFVVLLHFGFVAFVILGALTAFRWGRVLYFHVPAVIWAAWVEFSGSPCPLTPFENWLRERGGAPAYRGDFIEHYLLPILYPAALTREMQIALGAGALLGNALLYGALLRRRKPGGNRAQG